MTTIWYTRCPAPTAASVAIRQGWLDEEFAADGISVRSLAEAADEKLRLAHYSHDHPALFRFGGYVPPLIAQSRGADLKVIGLNWHDRVSGFFALPETGLRRGADLKGRRIALPVRRNDGVDWWRATVLAGIDQLLRSTGLEAGDVAIVPVEIDRTYFADAAVTSEARQSLWGARSQFAIQREEVAALYRGEVDAVYADAVQAAVLQATTGAVPVELLRGYEDDSDAGFGHPCVLTVSARLLRERPDLVDRWVARLLDAQAWVRAHRSETRRIFANDTGLPEALLDQAFSPRLTDQVDVSLADNRVALLERKTDHLLRHGFLDRAFDFGAMIDRGPLDRAMAARTAGRRA
ncbi:MAG: ABC transporter substrate-binding protein [Roseovarius sp.]|nr:ABC transporter substrate-binding protein [Roseovarius sp.]